MCSYLAVFKKGGNGRRIGSSGNLRIGSDGSFELAFGPNTCFRDGALAWLGPEYADYNLEFFILYPVYRHHCHYGTIGGNRGGEIFSFAL